MQHWNSCVALQPQSMGVVARWTACYEQIVRSITAGNLSVYSFSLVLPSMYFYGLSAWIRFFRPGEKVRHQEVKNQREEKTDCSYSSLW